MTNYVLYSNRREGGRTCVGHTADLTTLRTQAMAALLRGETLVRGYSLKANGDLGETVWPDHNYLRALQECYDHDK